MPNVMVDGFMRDSVTGALATTGGGGSSATSGTLAARPAATGAKALYTATDEAGGTTYLDTAAGVWTQVGSGVIPPTPGPAYNVQSTNFQKWRKALSRVRAGTANARILCIGDSTTLGATASTAALSYPLQLRKLLNAYHVPAVDGAIWGSDGTIADPRVVMGSGWDYNSAGGATFYGGGWHCSSGASGSISFTFAHAFDKIDVHYVQYTGGSVTVNVDGGASLGTITSPGSNVRGKQTFTCSHGTHTINITGAVGGTFYLVGVEAYSSVNPAVLVSNAGKGGSTAPGYADGVGPVSPMNMYDAYLPSLVVSAFGINDSFFGVTAAAYDTAMRSIISRVQPYGDMLLTSSLEGADTTRYAMQAAFRAKDRQMSTDAGAAFLDMRGRWGTYATANSYGYFSDGLHPSDFGYADWAAAVFNVLHAI